MRASLLSACALAALLVAPRVASAQVLHAGVDASALTPAGLALVDGSVPADGAAVRLLYAAEPGARPELMISVLLARDAAGARVALARFRQGVQARLAEAREAGDVSVRVDDAQLSLRVGTPLTTRGARIVPLVVSGDRLVVSAARGLELVAIEAHDPSLEPYRTSRGWFVRVRSGRTPTAADFTVVAVDSQLRVTAR